MAARLTQEDVCYRRGTFAAGTCPGFQQRLDPRSLASRTLALPLIAPLSSCFGRRFSTAEIDKAPWTRHQASWWNPEVLPKTARRSRVLRVSRAPTPKMSGIEVLSLVANIFQVINFASETIRLCNGIYNGQSTRRTLGGVCDNATIPVLPGAKPLPSDYPLRRR